MLNALLVCLIESLSAHQQDQSFLKVALDDLKVKENILQTLTESNNESSRIMEKIAKLITSFGKSIGDGLGLLAAALANNNQSVSTQHLANTYHQPETLQKSSSYSEFNPGYSFTNYQHHPPFPLLQHFIIVCSHKSPMQ